MTTAVVFGSGGARGVAHAGVIRALEEHGVDPDLVAGSSAGAVIGSLYADGHTADDIHDLVEDFRVYKFIDFTNFGSGILKGQKTKVFLQDQLGDATFDDLERDLVVNALDLNADTIKYIDTGDVVSAVHASMAIPGVFTPVERGDSYLLDAGYINPLPVQPLPACDRIILVDITPEYDGINEDSRFHDVIKQYFYYVQRHHQDQHLAGLDTEQPDADITVISPDTGEWNMLNFRSLDEVFDRGYDAAQATLSS